VTVSTGTVLDLMDVSSGIFTNVSIDGNSVAAVGVNLTLTTAGWTVYNRFNNCSVQQCALDYNIEGPSNNANVFIGCRARTFSNYGFYIDNARDNTFLGCQIEDGDLGDYGVYLVSSLGAGYSDTNRFIACRFEGTGASINITEADVYNTYLIGNYFGATTPATTNNGTGTVTS
jgi:hypothetical protein